jgi:hypothetical protein
MDAASNKDFTPTEYDLCRLRPGLSPITSLTSHFTAPAVIPRISCREKIT